jgi:hypothetical protein
MENKLTRFISKSYLSNSEDPENGIMICYRDKITKIVYRKNDKNSFPYV